MASERGARLQSCRIPPQRGERSLAGSERSEPPDRIGITTRTPAGVAGPDSRPELLLRQAISRERPRRFRTFPSSIHCQRPRNNRQQGLQLCDYPLRGVPSLSVLPTLRSRRRGRTPDVPAQHLPEPPAVACNGSLQESLIRFLNSFKRDSLGIRCWTHP